MSTDAAPASTPGPPWRCRVEAVLWWHRAAPGAVEALPAGLRGRRVTPVTVGAFVRYLDSPVGPYSEVFGAPVLVTGRGRTPGVAVPFIAVDSAASVRGGRQHWGLPKTLALFAWEGLRAVSASEVAAAAAAAGWSVRADVRVRGPRLPFAGVLPATNLLADGCVASSRVRQVALGRLGTVEVAVSGAALSSWLLPGRHRCLEITRGRMTVGAPRT